MPHRSALLHCVAVFCHIYMAPIAAEGWLMVRYVTCVRACVRAGACVRACQQGVVDAFHLSECSTCSAISNNHFH
jgi:hypothetical protein